MEHATPLEKQAIYKLLAVSAVVTLAKNPFADFGGMHVDFEIEDWNDSIEKLMNMPEHPISVEPGPEGTVRITPTEEAVSFIETVLD